MAVTVFGNKFNNQIVRFLAKRKSAQLSDLLEGTLINRGSLSEHLKELEEIGVVNGDIDPKKRRGKSVNYSLDHDRVRELMRAHTAYLLDLEEPQGRQATE